MKLNIFSYIKEFGLLVFISKSIKSRFWNNYSVLGKFIGRVNEKIIKRKLLKTIISNIDLDDIMNRSVIVGNVPKHIYTMWWQGIEDAPEIIRFCINNMKKLNPNCDVTVISKENYFEYVDIPEFIFKLVEGKKISFTHLSDIVRCKILSKYGGVWIDSTIYMSHELDDIVFNNSFYSIKTGVYTNDPSHGEWTTFFMASVPNSIVFNFMDSFFEKYFQKYSIMIDYILQDYMLRLACEIFNEVRDLVDQVPINNTKCFDLRPILNETHELSRLSNFSPTYIYKLSWKSEFLLESNGKDTLYKKLMSLNK